MSGQRYVLLGLASGAPGWMTKVQPVLDTGQPAGEFLPCAGIADLTNRLASGRPFSALLIDHRTVGLDRELIQRSHAAHCPVIVVGKETDAGRWKSLGADEVISSFLADEDLRLALQRHGNLINQTDRFRKSDTQTAPPAIGDKAKWQNTSWHGRLIAVTGPGGTGASSVARALALGLGHDPRFQKSVALVDACLEADQAHLHGVDPGGKNLQQAVQAHRTGQPTAQELFTLMIQPSGAPYRLLPGLLRRRDWPAAGGSSLRSTLINIARHHLVTVVDVDPFVDLAPEEQPTSPSTPGEIARVVMNLADFVVVVGRPSERDAIAQQRTLNTLVAAGVDDKRISPLILYPAGPRPRWRSPFGRKKLTATNPTGEISDPGTDPSGESAAQIARRIAAQLDRLTSRTQNEPDTPLPPGSLGNENRA
ncbi:MAG: hypothetical protein HN361_08945 [Actinobacteria bacterium]|nr:hypothetical protein [Actinomycetota bacterium]MBT4010592.1 hypothetical protein [Actinomycetota bacterium]MBT4303113.1 hypothetical protein [Actinomycetota bacterium]